MSIQIRNIRKSFGEKQVLKGIDFDFEPGKVNMIIGTSGCGKSVLVKCMVGLLRPEEGSVIYDKTDFYKANRHQIRDIRNDIGMLFQASALFDSMTVYENVAFPLRMFSDKSKTEIQDRVRFCLDRVNLKQAEHLFPSELSGGMKKRVGIARAIAMNPRFLFCDEPNSGLDPLTSSVIDKLIQEITMEYQTTTVVITHDMNSVLNIGDRIMYLFQGHKEWEGTRHEVMRSTNERLNEFIFVSDLIRRDL